MSSPEVKKAARVVFERFKNNQNSSQPYLGAATDFYPSPFNDRPVVEEAFHILELRNLIMRYTGRSTYEHFALTSFGKSVNFADVFEKTVDRGMVTQLYEIVDQELARQCFDKSYEDAIMSAFRVLEERLRHRINAPAELFGLPLVEEVFHPGNGRLTFGETEAERDALYQIYRSAFLMLRNPPAHRRLEEFAGAEIIEVVMFVDFLLKILTKASERPSASTMRLRSK